MTTEEAVPWAADMAMNMVGVPGGVGGVGAGARLRRSRSAISETLPMDEAARMARAKQMGFYTDMPLYHGTDRSFPEFDLSKGGATTGAEPARLGVWAARDPAIADEFAALAASRRGGSPQTMPLVHRAERPAVLRLSGEEEGYEIAATLMQAWDDGFNSVMLKNYTSPGGKSGDILVVKDPAQLRSKYAVFDPAKKSSSNLLAGLAGLAVSPTYLAAPALQYLDQQQTQ